MNEILKDSSMKMECAVLSMHVATVRDRIVRRESLDLRDIEVLTRAGVRLCQWPADATAPSLSDADIYQAQRAEDNGARNFTDARVLFSLGLAGEAGEVVDYVKKAIGHGKEMNRETLTEELGDVLWYISQLAHIHGITLSEIMRYNTGKLQARYPNGFLGNLPHWSERYHKKEGA